MQKTGIVGDGALWAEKDKDAALNYTFDLSRVISDGDRVVACTFAVATAMPGPDPSTMAAVAGTVIGDASVTVKLAAGTPNVWFNVTGHYVTDKGVSDDFTLRLFIQADGEAESVLGTTLFPNRYTAVLRLLKDRLPQAVRGVLRAELLSEDYIWSKLMAAEGEVSRKLGGVALTPTEVFSGPEAPAAAVAALNGLPYMVEPAYDLPPDFFGIGQYGMLRLNQPFVSKISAMTIVHPAQPLSPLFSVPIEWIQLVGKQGLVNVIPGGPAAALTSLPLGVFTLQAVASGYPLPQAIRMQYTAGLTASSPFMPEILDVAQRIAVVSVLTDAMVPQSGSISADGLSRSISQDVSKHQDAIDAKLEGLKDRIVGPVWAVL